ncbi:MAG: DUF4123 domain-containing protein [Acidobacteria bacterium]|nr:DUF4123 domain-containing protein [Acidobacteriota bacterium]
MREDLRRALWPFGPQPNIWAIVDAAQDQKVYWTLTNSFLQHSCLFAGALPEALEMAAPYLVQLDPEDKFTEYLAENMGQSLGVFLKCDLGLADLRHHLRRFLTVVDPAGRRMLFRYYDPRVLRTYLPTCNSDELQTVFGPVKAFWTEAEVPNQLTQFEVHGSKLQVTKQTLHGPRGEGAGEELAPEIVPAQKVLVVQRQAKSRSRVPILLQGAGAGGKLTRSNPSVCLYRTATAPEELPFPGGAYTIPPSGLDPDVTVYAEAVTPGDVALTLEPSRGGRTQVTVTGVALQLDTGGDVCTGVGIAARRRIAVLPVEPRSFKGRLLLRTAPGGPALTLYNSEDATEGYDLTEGFGFDTPRAPVSFWIEGKTLSAKPGDATLQLLVEGGTTAGDFRPVTVAAIEPILVTIPSTPSKAKRLPEAAAAKVFEGRTLVLVSGATDLENPLQLRTASVPEGLPIVWTVTRAADDSDAVRAHSVNPVPSLRDASLLTDAAGTFHLCASTSLWGGPAAALELVLVHAALSENRSSVNGRFCACARVPGTDQFRLHSGKDPAVRLDADIELTGGGPDGRRGLDSIRGGWVNNIVSDNTGARYKGGATAAKLYKFKTDAGEATVDFEHGPLLDAASGDSPCLPASESTGPSTFKAHLSPATQWKINHGSVLDRTIEQIWRYLDCRTYLAVWSADAPGQLGVLMRTGWSFTGDYACNTTKTLRTTVAARLATTGTVTYPALLPAARTELEAHPPVSGRGNGDE